MASRRRQFTRISGMPRWTRSGHALRSPMRSLASIIGMIVLFAIVAWIAARLDPLPPRFTGTATASDGDSLRVGGDRIRLLGLDAPELDQICWDAAGAEWRCGRAAADKLSELVRAGQVECQPEGTDRYGRTLARCAVAGNDLGARMVRAGLALATDAYGADEAAAKRVKTGLWQGRFVDPKTWRDEGPSGDPGKGLLETLWDGFRELTGARTLR